MSLRPQAHEIIRTWAFYTIVKSTLHFGQVPWKDALISGWGLAGEGMGKISKSRGGGPMAPIEMIRRYSADALRYWAASTSPGKDALISEDKIQAGSRLATKLWNVARFSEPFLAEGSLSTSEAADLAFTPSDRWILSRLQQVIRRVTDAFAGYDYTTAKNEVEAFFWQELADNYIEMAKQRLYDRGGGGARVRLALRCEAFCLTVLKLLAPILALRYRSHLPTAFLRTGAIRFDPPGELASGAGNYSATPLQKKPERFWCRSPPPSGAIKVSEISAWEAN